MSLNDSIAAIDALAADCPNDEPLGWAAWYGLQAMRFRLTGELPKAGARWYERRARELLVDETGVTRFGVRPILAR